MSNIDHCYQLIDQVKKLDPSAYPVNTLGLLLNKVPFEIAYDRACHFIEENFAYGVVCPKHLEKAHTAFQVFKMIPSPNGFLEVQQYLMAALEDALIKLSKQESTIKPENSSEPKKIFLGHGRSKVWKELKDFISERLHLPWEEFNREATAGISTQERLQTMMDNAVFAFLIMTAEDKQVDGTVHARENVIHEVGLFQGRLGFKKAIILLEEECSEFTNITGLTQIRFPKGDIGSRFEEVRRVLEREGIINKL